MDGARCTATGLSSQEELLGFSGLRWKREFRVYGFRGLGVEGFRVMRGCEGLRA